MFHASKQITKEKQLGNAGEQFVEHWLKNQGFSHIISNYRIRGGEIDLIAQRNNLIVFIEVKVRTTDYFNSSQLITLSKQRKIISTALYYCRTHALYNKSLRFDVALLKKEATGFEMTYIPNAFTQTENQGSFV